MRKRIFISRNLAEDSIFKTTLEVLAELEAQSLIHFEAVPIVRFPECDWLFFYSKKGVDFGWAGLRTRHPFPKVAVLGQASAEYLEQQYGYHADFVGTGAAEATAKAFLKNAKGQRVCFVQAQNSRQSVAKQLGHQVQAQTLVVYANTPKAVLSIPKCDILVFTSPLNAQAYYQQYAPQVHQTVVAIGQTTAKALEQLGISNFRIAPHPHEKALADTCLSLLSE
ncbi:MAG: uroporphyrinogen-III synthase [Aureispira sp.]